MPNLLFSFTELAAKDIVAVDGFPIERIRAAESFVANASLEGDIRDTDRGSCLPKVLPVQ
jgi:hypothetical protein